MTRCRALPNAGGRWVQQPRRDLRDEQDCAGPVAYSQGVATMEQRRLQHLVSKGYQRNFANGVWLTIIDPEPGAVVDEKRSIKTNWRLQDFLSVTWSEDDVDDALERVRRARAGSPEPRPRHLAVDQDDTRAKARTGPAGGNPPRSQPGLSRQAGRGLGQLARRRCPGDGNKP